MAGDRAQFRDHMKKWESLREAKRFSLAPDIGYTAIVYSHSAKIETEDESGYMEEEYPAFAEEARAISEQISAQNGKPFIIRGVDPVSFEEGVLSQRNVANLVIIGHGTFSSVYCDDGNEITWGEVADMTTHLKTGYIEQRFCGGFRQSLSVPFGLFAVSAARNVFAAPGKYFAPEKVPEHESLMQRVTTAERLSYAEIRERFAFQLEEDS